MTDTQLVHQAVPAREGPAPHPGLILLHGRGADEKDLLSLADIDPRFFTISLRAPLRLPSGGYMWYQLDQRGVGFPEIGTLQASLDLLRRFLTEVVPGYPIDATRLYAGGFSMGAVMSGTLGLLYPDVIAGAIMLSGYLPLHSGLPFRPEAAAGHHFFEAHGTMDRVIPISFGRAAMRYLEETPVDLTYREYPIAHQIGPQEFEDLHAWVTDTLDQGGQGRGDTGK